jgi:hypothetical protein
MVDTPTPITVDTFCPSGTKTAPSAGTIADGYLPNELLPAEHFNYLLNKITADINATDPATVSAIAELKTLLTAASLTPSSGSTVQVKAALDALYQAKANGANWATALAAALGSGWTTALAATMGTPLQSTGTQAANSFDTSSTAPAHTGRLNFDGAFWATTVNTPSTKEIKQDIEEFKESALEVINGVKVVSYTLIADEAKEKQIGFIAEDTDERLAGENHDCVKIGNTLGLLIKAVQELTARVEVLEARYGGQLSV